MQHGKTAAGKNATIREKKQKNERIARWVCFQWKRPFNWICGDKSHCIHMWLPHQCANFRATADGAVDADSTLESERERGCQKATSHQISYQFALSFYRLQSSDASINFLFCCVMIFKRFAFTCFFASFCFFFVEMQLFKGWDALFVKACV